MEVQVTDFEEVLAVWEAHIDGFVYDDGEVWADTASLERWRRAREHHVCVGCGIFSATPVCAHCRHTDLTHDAHVTA